MCPLRFILIFLSATLAGIFFLRGINNSYSDSDDSTSSSSPSAPKKYSSKIVNGFWICVDMASGRYLWRNLSSLSKKSE